MTDMRADRKGNAGRPNEIYKLCIAMVAHGVIHRRPGVKPKQATAAATTLLCDLWRQEGEEFRDDEKFNVAVRKHLQKLRNGKVRARESTRQVALFLAQKGGGIEEAIEEVFRRLKT